MSSTAVEEHFSIHGAPDYGKVSRIFRVIFWVHQVLFGLPSVVVGPGLLFRSIRAGITPQESIIELAMQTPILAALFLAWIGGTLLWGFACLLHHPLFSGSEMWSQADPLGTASIVQEAPEIEGITS